jgi:hypothetical protein
MWLYEPRRFDGLEGLRKAMMPRLKRNLNVLGVIGNTFIRGAPDFSNNRERAKV